jgi:excisionase family DNA binding protein
MDGQRYMNVDHLAALLGVSRKTAYGWVSAKTILHVTFSGSVLRFKPSDIEAWAESRAVAVGSCRAGPSASGTASRCRESAGKGAA